MTHIAFVMLDPTMVKGVHEVWELHRKIFGKTVICMIPSTAESSRT